MSLKAKIEAVIYAADEPVTLAQLSAIFLDEVLGLESTADPAAAETMFDEEQNDSATSAEAPEMHGEQPALPIEDAEARKQARLRERRVRVAIEAIVAELMADYANGERGMEIREIAGGYRMATKAEYHDAVRSFVRALKPPMKLSLQALETLAVVAYKQPVTAPEISEIRGVDSSGVLGSLISRKLIATAGRKQVIGRPILYKTTKEFLMRFGLKDVNELPSIEEFEKMASEMSGEDESSEMANEEALPDTPLAGTTQAEAVDSQNETLEVTNEQTAESRNDGSDRAAPAETE